MEFSAKNLTPDQIAAAWNELARRANKLERWEVRRGIVVKVGTVDESTKIHPDAKPLFNKNYPDLQVGWVYVHENLLFDLVAEEHADSISVYIQWGDDQPGDMYSFEHWDEVRRDLDRIISSIIQTNKISGISD